MSFGRGNRFTQIGVDRLIRLKWLEKTVSLVLAGNEQATIKTTLQADLKNSFRSDNPHVRGSLDKTITILLKVWARVPSELDSLHAGGLELIQRLPPQDHIAIHWGMVMAVYPFWSSVATQVGRLLRLQSSAAAVQVQRRLREQYGERETVSRRTRYVLRSFLDWGVLKEANKKGIYSPSPPTAVEDSRLIAWLVEASLQTRVNGSAPLKDLLDSPSFFPFQIKPIHADTMMAASTTIDVLRHGLDEDLVMLRK